MLEDFIKSNELQAKILPIPVKAPTIKCQLFRCGDADVLAIHFASKEIDPKKLAKAEDAKGISTRFIGSYYSGRASPTGNRPFRCGIRARIGHSAPQRVNRSACGQGITRKVLLVRDIWSCQ